MSPDLIQVVQDLDYIVLYSENQSIEMREVASESFQAGMQYDKDNSQLKKNELGTVLFSPPHEKGIERDYTSDQIRQEAAAYQNDSSIPRELAPVDYALRQLKLHEDLNARVVGVKSFLRGIEFAQENRRAKLYRTMDPVICVDYEPDDLEWLSQKWKTSGIGELEDAYEQDVVRPRKEREENLQSVRSHNSRVGGMLGLLTGAFASAISYGVLERQDSPVTGLVCAAALVVPPLLGLGIAHLYTGRDGK